MKILPKSHERLYLLTEPLYCCHNIKCHCGLTAAELPAFMSHVLHIYLFHVYSSAMLIFCVPSNPTSDCDPDPGHHIGSCSSADDFSWDSNSPGSPAEDPPAAGDDCSSFNPDPDASTPQPCPAANSTLRWRVTSAATHSAPAIHKGSSSPGWYKSQNSCQTQRWEQLGRGTGIKFFPAVQRWLYWHVVMVPTAANRGRGILKRTKPLPHPYHSLKLNIMVFTITHKYSSA